MIRWRVLLILLLAWWVVSPTLAEEPVWVQAARWARTNNGIAVYVSLGSDAGYSSGVVRDFFVTGFKSNFDIEAKPFIEVDEKSGTVVSYFFLEVAREPVPFNRATSPEYLKNLVNVYRAALLAAR